MYPHRGVSGGHGRARLENVPTLCIVPQAALWAQKPSSRTRYGVFFHLQYSVCLDVFL
jgi:hypothetical protein